MSSTTEDSWIPVSKDGQVKKKILKQGTGQATPPLYSLVEVHYTGTLENGKKFDSSRDRDETFEFMLGAGEVIRGWDLGVKTMKQGEICILSVPHEYAYGKEGISGVIPPAATLNFEVELLSWQQE